MRISLIQEEQTFVLPLKWNAALSTFPVLLSDVCFDQFPSLISYDALSAGGGAEADPGGARGATLALQKHLPSQFWLYGRGPIFVPLHIFRRRVRPLLVRGLIPPPAGGESSVRGKRGRTVSDVWSLFPSLPEKEKAFTLSSVLCFCLWVPYASLIANKPLSLCCV